MSSLTVIWAFTVAGLAFAILWDMRRLMVHRAGLTRCGWVVCCLFVGPFGGLAYLLHRPVVRLKLIDAAWAMAGDASYPPEVRRQRLVAMRNARVIGRPIYRHCIRALEMTE
jgi:hypothetical protein